jgi:beta-glucosidase
MPRVNHARIAAKDQLTISVDVTNSGSVAGDEVVQLYLTHEGITGAPRCALRGFQRIHLDRGQTKTVSFRLHDRDLDVVDPAGKHQIPAGTVTAWLGGGQPTERSATKTPGAQTKFTISDAATLPD